MREKLIVAGFGGQGVMLLGKLIAQTMMNDGKSVTYFPSYGSEVRGGTAHCHVILSSDEIYSPVVEVADTVLVMNEPSYRKFRGLLRPDGLLLVNSSLVHNPEAQNATIVRIPATDVGNELGNVLAANMVMLGAYNHLRSFLPVETFLACLKESLTGRKASLYELNKSAVLRGAELAASSETQSCHE